MNILADRDGVKRLRKIFSRDSLGGINYFRPICARGRTAGGGSPVQNRIAAMMLRRLSTILARPHVANPREAARAAIVAEAKSGK